MSFTSAQFIRRLRAAARLFAPRVVKLTASLAAVPAPTFHEEARATCVERYLAADPEVSSVARDGINNVTARLPGRRHDRQVLLAAHLDTVFPLETPLEIRREHDRLIGPGVGDNAVALASLIVLPGLLRSVGATPATDLVLAATVGEEGFGNLRGIRNVLNEQPETRAVIAIEGHHVGRMTHKAVGSRRYEVRFRGPGGHSFGHFGRASAIHALGAFVERISDLPLDCATKTTLNVGTVAGGTSVNTIAAEASLSLEIRSLDQNALESLSRQVMRIGHALEGGGISVDFELIGERPAAMNPPGSAIARRVSDAMASLGIELVRDISSTDANLPLSEGIPSVCIGITHGENAHRPDESIEIPPIATGLAQLALVALSVSEGVASGEVAPYTPGRSARPPIVRHYSAVQGALSQGLSDSSS